jgi:hypothetical protein
MAELRKAQVLLEPEEYERLEAIARRRGVSVPELIRLTVRERYMPVSQARQDAGAAILRLRIPAEWGDWQDIEEESERAHDNGLP